jgi:hypothetical protein
LGTAANGDQSFVTSGVFSTMAFERVAGAWSYVGQFGSPKRTTIYSVAHRDLIGARLPAGGNFWFVLLQQDGTNAPGWYSVDSDGIQSGPFVGANPVASATVETTSFVAAKPANSVGADGDQVTITAGSMQSMVFEKVAGVWTYRCQSGLPTRLTVMPAADRTAIAAELSIGQMFSYSLISDDGASLKGMYSVDSDGIQTGPY